MTTMAYPTGHRIRLPRWPFAWPFSATNHRRRATMDLIHSSPHLLQDIGAVERGYVKRRS